MPTDDAFLGTVTLNNLLNARERIHITATRPAPSYLGGTVASHLAYVTETPARWNFTIGLLGYAGATRKTPSYLLTKLRESGGQSGDLSLDFIQYVEVRYGDEPSIGSSVREIVKNVPELVSYPDLVLTNFDVCKSLYPNDPEGFDRCMSELGR